MLKLTGNNKTKKFPDFTLVSMDTNSAGITAEFSFLLETTYGIIDAQDDVDECAFNIRVGATNGRVYIEVVPDDMTYYHEISLYFNNKGRCFDYEGCTSVHKPIVEFLKKFLTFNGQPVDLSYLSSGI